jgi:hypothetical protein
MYLKKINLANKCGFILGEKKLIKAWSIASANASSKYCFKRNLVESK